MWLCGDAHTHTQHTVHTYTHTQSHPLSSLEWGPDAGMRLGSRELVSTRYRTAGDSGRVLCVGVWVCVGVCVCVGVSCVCLYVIYIHNSSI